MRSAQGSADTAQRKEDVMRQHLVRFKGDEGLLFIGMAQQKSRVFRTEVHPIRRPSSALAGSSRLTR